jgi:hypothetical protein
MVQEDSGMISCCVGHVYVGHEAPGLPLTQLSLRDFKFSCHRDTDEQNLRNLISRMESHLKEIVLDAYYGSSERIAD